MTHAKLIPMALLIVLISLLTVTTAYSDESARSSAMPILGLTISASQLPRYYPNRFQVTGVIFRMNNNGQITVSGSAQAYTLSPNALIHSMSTEFSSRHALSKGTEIGFSVNNRNRHTITEIWILPEGAIKPS